MISIVLFFTIFLSSGIVLAKDEGLKGDVIAKKEAVPQKESRILVNNVAAVVHGPERTRIFTHLECERPNIDSKRRSLPEQISGELTYQNALTMKLPIDDAIVRAHLRKVLQAFNLKAGDEDKIFAQEGYSPQEGFEQFRVTYAVNAMTEHHIMSNLLVSDEEVVAYYKAHPIIKEAEYLIQMASVACDGDTTIKIEKDVDHFIKTGEGLSVVWSEAAWVKTSELADSLQAIKTADVGFVLKIKQPDSILLYRVVNKKAEREVPLAKRYKKIVNILRKPKFEQLQRDYHKKLMDDATVVYLEQPSVAAAPADYPFEEETEA